MVILRTTREYWLVKLKVRSDDHEPLSILILVTAIAIAQEEVGYEIWDL